MNGEGVGQRIVFLDRPTKDDLARAQVEGKLVVARAHFTPRMLERLEKMTTPEALIFGRKQVDAIRQEIGFPKGHPRLLVLCDRCPTTEDFRKCVLEAFSRGGGSDTMSFGEDSA